MSTKAAAGESPLETGSVELVREKHENHERYLITYADRSGAAFGGRTRWDWYAWR